MVQGMNGRQVELRQLRIYLVYPCTCTQPSSHVTYSEEYPAYLGNRVQLPEYSIFPQLKRNVQGAEWIFHSAFLEVQITEASK